MWSAVCSALLACTLALAFRFPVDRDGVVLSCSGRGKIVGTAFKLKRFTHFNPKFRCQERICHEAIFSEMVAEKVGIHCQSTPFSACPLYLLRLTISEIRIARKIKQADVMAISIRAYAATQHFTIAKNFT